MGVVDHPREVVDRAVGSDAYGAVLLGHVVRAEREHDAEAGLGDGEARARPPPATACATSEEVSRRTPRL